MKVLKICTAHSHLNRRKTLLALMTITLIASLLGATFPFNTNVNDKTVSADSVFYDFISEASTASWMSGAGSLPFPGSDSDSRGFALYRDNWQLEDGSTWAKVLETHPQWVSNGWIMGRYPQLTVPSDAELKVTVGFLKGATETGGVTFEVRFEEGQNRQTIISLQATYDGKLDSMTASLSSLAGKTGYFILYVNAGQDSSQDWAAWAEAKIEVAAPAALPDLKITDVWSSDGQLCYKVKNIGQGNVGGAVASVSFYNVLFIDGERVAEDLVTTPLASGQELERCFDYQWQMTPPEHEIRVCADWDKDVAESNEQNNCWEQVWTMEEELPDLIIEEIKCDRENSRIGYVIKNVGGATAPSGHATTLYVDGKEICHDVMDYDLESDVIYRSWFQEYTWPERHTIEVRVCADNYEQIEESNEQNNCKEQVCEYVADIIPPVIISGPTMSQIGPTMAVICWETDEASDSLVRYDNRAGEYGSVAQDSSLVTEHCLKLSNLESATTYHFLVESQDSSGNSVSSRDLNFETLSPSDDENPSLFLLVSDTLSGKATISADAQDNTGVDRVVFFLDGEPVFTDFSPPFEWQCDTGVLGEGSHNIRAETSDIAGNIAEDTHLVDVQNQFPVDLSPVHVRIINPESNAEVYGEMPISVEVTHDLDFGIKTITVEVEGVLWERPFTEGHYENPVTGHWEQGPGLEPPGLEPIWVPTGYPQPPMHTTCFWDFSGLELGSTHNIYVEAEDEHGNWGHAQIQVQISEPEIVISRYVARHDNYFKVTLTIENNGEVPVERFTVSDTDIGFQCLKTGWVTSKPSGGDWGRTIEWDYEVETQHAGHPSTITTGSLGNFRPGEAIRLEYYAVPTLVFPTPEVATYEFGNTLEVTYQVEGEEYSLTEPLSTWVVSSGELDSAFSDADYLIVTKPPALFANYDSHKVNELLATMAELAKEKNGVLGYICYGGDADSLKHSISPGGAWYEKLTSLHVIGYFDGITCMGSGPFDYLLLVGETEIVPSFYPTTSRFLAETGGDIDCSDYPYADIIGNDLRPELRVGRIVGDDAAALVKPIQASINVHKHLPGHEFDRSDALLTSGPEGTWEQFVSDTNQIGDILASYGTTTDYVRREYYTTEVDLLREAVFILGTMWECRPPDSRTPFPAELEHLRHLTCVYCPTPPGDLVDLDGDGNPDCEHKDVCPKRHDLASDLTGLHRLISTNDAILVEEVRRDGPVCQTYDYNFPRPDGTSAWDYGTTQLINKMPDKDIFYMNGHGNRGTWAEFDTGNFGGSHPVVFADSCLTGAYEAKIDPVLGNLSGYGAPESSFKAGAAVYIGSTEVAPADSEHGFEFARKFFAEYWLPGTSCGDALTEQKDWMWMTGDSYFQYMNYEFNLYGDPKFGD